MYLRSDVDKFAVVFSVAIIVVTLFFSLSSWARAAVWYIYTRTVTAMFVYTKIYQVYLDVDMPSSKLYEKAVEKTEKLKDKEIEARLERKRRKRQEEERNQGTAADQAGGNGGTVRQRGNPQQAENARGTTNGPRQGRWWNCMDTEQDSQQNMV
jgi:hypothetical protein